MNFAFFFVVFFAGPLPLAITVPIGLSGSGGLRPYWAWRASTAPTASRTPPVTDLPAHAAAGRAPFMIAALTSAGVA